MSGLSTSSSDSHEFILLPEHPTPSALVQIGTPASPPLRPSTFPPPAPSSPPLTRRRFVKRSHGPDESSSLSSPAPEPTTPPAPAYYSHSRRGSASPGGSSSRERSPPIIAPHESLVGDVHMSKTRVIISKTHTIYDTANVPFPPAPSARVRDAEITLRFLSSNGDSAPIIKAITPTSRGIGPTTSVTDSYSTTAGLNLGYTAAGTLELSRTAQKTYTHSTQARISSSGVETNELWLTLTEDPSARQGIPTTVDFAALVHLTSSPPFEAELSVGVTIGRGPQALLKMLSSPQEWIALYDGTTGLNPVRLATPSSSSFRPSGLVTAPVDDQDRLAVATERMVTRGLKKQRSDLMEC
ncbi:uncharacterized protein JCM15063_003658 [Sporobolomyces koalae]|uniref:uncharacterized protein n=1 Tax=Sporobolomyces koalae TaxID=500713 RepID=UPI00316DE5C0